MLIEGAIFDVDGPRPGYVRLDRGRVVETGTVGADGTRGRVKKLRGIVVPAPVNSHTHLGDAVSTREPPRTSVEQLVAAPGSYKFRLLADADPHAKVRAMRGALRRLTREGVAAVVDFREEGLPGIRALREAARTVPIEVLALGRPLARPIEAGELAALLTLADGIGLSSAREESLESRRVVARACRARGKRYALHASEATREPPEAYLDPRPDLLVHLARATRDDLLAVREEKVPVAVCPRANALFGRQPDLGAMERLGLVLLLGSDNAMLESPSVWRELEFAYASSRLLDRPVSAEFLVRAALVAPWVWLGRPRQASIAAGSPARPLVLRLPPEDPVYQIATRTTEHVILRPPARVRGVVR
jgi:cytosine/adenosine deaminase-related metal-dependent hydrolase